jgi:hypothetical protein
MYVCFGKNCVTYGRMLMVQTAGTGWNCCSEMSVSSAVRVCWVLHYFCSVFVRNCCVIKLSFVKLGCVVVVVVVSFSCMELCVLTAEVQILKFFFNFPSLWFADMLVTLVLIKLGRLSLYQLKAGKWGCNFVSHLHYSGHINVLTLRLTIIMWKSSIFM